MNKHLLLTMLACCIFTASASDVSYVDITINESYTSSEVVSGFPMLVKINNDKLPGIYSAVGNPTNELKFTSSSGTVNYPYEIDTWNTSGESLVWVKLPTFNKDTEFRMYYGEEDEDRTWSASDVWDGYDIVCHLNGTADDVSGNNIEGRLNLNDGKDPIATWDSGIGNFCFTNNVARGSTNTYEFVAIGDLNGEYVTNRVNGVFIATTYTDWFSVEFNDPGYVSGGTWAAESTDKCGGTWDVANPTFTVLSEDPTRILKFDDDHDEVVKYTARTPSEVNADVSVSGTIAATSGNGVDVPNDAIVAIKFVSGEGENILPAVYYADSWHSFGAGGFSEGQVVEYRVDFDYVSDEAPRYRVTVGSYVSPYCPLSQSEYKVSAVGFAGADVGDFMGWYWSLLQDQSGPRQGMMFYLR